MYHKWSRNYISVWRICFQLDSCSIFSFLEGALQTIVGLFVFFSFGHCHPLISAFYYPCGILKLFLSLLSLVLVCPIMAGDVSALEFTSIFCLVRCAQYVVFQIIVPFRLAIALSVHLRFTASDYSVWYLQTFIISSYSL